MSSLRTRFRTLDAVAAPDLWSEVTRRAEMPGLSGLERVVAQPRGRQAGTADSARRRGLSIGWAVGLVALLLVAITGSFLLGGAFLPSPTPTITPTTGPAEAPTSSPRQTPSPTATRPSTEPTPGETPAATPSRTPARSPLTTSGTAQSALGGVSWTSTQGDANSIPDGGIFETPDGFAAFELSPDGPGSRLWSSLDGTAWKVAPPPVQTDGRIGHAFVAGEHWIWSNDFKLWHSPDFVAWTEVDLTDFRPTPIPGFRRDGWRPVTAGSTTLQHWEPFAFPDFAEILALPLPAGEIFRLEGRGAEPAVGNVLDVVADPNGAASPVGAIRVDLAGSIVTITDVDRGVVASEIDAAALGQDARELAEHLVDHGDIHLPAVAAAITDGVARPAVFPQDWQVLGALDGRFVALTSGDPDAGEPHLVWVSTDGQQWEPLGAPEWPVSGAVLSINWLLEDPESQAADTLTMRVTVGGPEHTELWSSDDAVNWTQVGVLPHYLYAPERVAGGYVALGSDNSRRLYVSVDGTEWSPVDGAPKMGRLVDSSGGRVSWSWTTRRVAFIVESANNGFRDLLSLRFGAR